MVATVLFLAFAADPTSGVPEAAPPPRPARPSVAVAAVKGGYAVTLSRSATERLQQAVDQTDEKDVAASLRDMAREKKDGATPDPEGAAKLELIAFLVANQLPGFKTHLRENTGPGGAVITVTGLQAATVKTGRPRLDRMAERVRGVMPLLPADARGAVEALRAVGRTTPLSWKVEPRE